MTWEVIFGDEFDEEYDGLSQPVQDELIASAKLLTVRASGGTAARGYAQRFLLRQHEGAAFQR